MNNIRSRSSACPVRGPTSLETSNNEPVPNPGYSLQRDSSIPHPHNSGCPATGHLSIFDAARYKASYFKAPSRRFFFAFAIPQPCCVVHFFPVLNSPLFSFFFSFDLVGTA
ncbi:hypothetical protein GWI33_016982 [Rhynchophorus ferrugineus]|uniref:Uncharacterized protein n=1 Tax=Rhynchophorus ferrugineus TaxID=354439 RepID=A0A834M848_RHYFE|nr:hypothetical protein GWI33_016982 [Rhynchophorus ferrugineus]